MEVRKISLEIWIFVMAAEVRGFFGRIDKNGVVIVDVHVIIMTFVGLFVQLVFTARVWPGPTSLSHRHTFTHIHTITPGRGAESYYVRLPF